MKAPTLAQLLKSISVGMALVGMVLATTIMQNGHMTLGLGMLMLFVLSYAAAENAFRRPRYWLVPGFWVLFSVTIGAGAKGEGILLGLLPLLLVMSWVRKQEAKADSAPAGDGVEAPAGSEG